MNDFTIDGGLRAASRAKLLAGRECKSDTADQAIVFRVGLADTEVAVRHLTTRNTICPACYPGE